jgi:N-acetyl-gamma-glutamyl-phosphate reductase
VRFSGDPSVYSVHRAQSIDRISLFTLGWLVGRVLLPCLFRQVQKKCCINIRSGSIIIANHLPQAIDAAAEDVNQVIKAAIVGASGYSGGELVRLLHGHDDVELTALSSRTYVGKRIGDVFPSLRGLEYRFEEFAPEEIVSVADVLFVAAPSGVAMSYAPTVAAAGKKMIDLGADFRFRGPSTYEKWYKVSHTCKDLLAKAAYGLPEIHRSEIAEADIVGNPGCYPTSVILALAPLLSEDALDGKMVIADSKSGISGAGRSADLAYNFCEIDEGVRPYGVLKHRHTPEMEQELSLLAGTRITAVFTPHLIPMVRGIVSTVYARLKPGYTKEQVRSWYEKRYSEEPFIRLLDEGSYPSTKSVYGSNLCDISVDFDEASSMAVVASALDNLGKGAASQAVQIMNVMFGLDETAGIAQLPVFP